MNRIPGNALIHRGSQNWLAECYVQLLLANVLVLIASMLIPDIESYSGIIIFLTFIATSNCLVVMVRSHAPLANPISIYAAIWLVLVPLTSLEAPLMEPMSSFEWKMCAGFGVTYCLAGLIVARRKGITAEGSVTTYEISPATENALLGLIGLSIVAMLVNFALGGVALLSEDEMARKTLSTFLGYSFLSSLGSVGVTLLANHYHLRKPKRYVALLVVYLALQALTGTRFVAIITLIMTGVMVASHRLGKKHFRLLMLGGVCVLLVFSFVSAYRSSSEHMEYYYISSGIYRGEASDLTSTELVRYFGMNQRNMTTVLSRDFSSDDLLEYTLSPVTSILTGDPGGLGTSIYGYTANNIIAYTYHDAGFAMWVILFIWSVLINATFILYSRNRASLMCAYWWSTMAMSLTMSFFAYLNAYAYWMFLFPIVVWFIQILFSQQTAKKTVVSTGNHAIESGAKS